jgi:glycosyltransferase involved in cell wall biosynthesis
LELHVKASVLISVVVCTHNRADLLEKAILSLIAQSLAPDAFEIIVVDNNSSDRTPTVAEKYVRLHTNIRYCRERKQGVSYARNLGWREAQGEYLAYLDDDATAPGQWLEVAAGIIAQRHPHIFGGPFYAMYDKPKPEWFKDEYESHSLGAAARELVDGEFLTGTNLFILRDSCAHVGGFDPQLGMSGEAFGYGEETAFILAARKKIPGIRVYYDPDLKLFHRVAEHKMSLRATAYRRVVDGRYAYRIFGPERKVSKALALRSTAKLAYYGTLFIANCTAGCLGRNRALYPFWENYVYERSFPYLHKLGAAYEALVRALSHQ